MQVIDFKSHTQMAQHLAKYITDASTIRAHCINSWGKSPSLEMIRVYQKDLQRKPKKVAEPKETDAIIPRLGKLRQKHGARQAARLAEIREEAAQYVLDKSRPIGRSVIEMVASVYRISVDELTGKGRAKHLVHPRFMAIRLLADVEKDGERRFSYPQIGVWMGGRDHSTIMHAIDQFEENRKRSVDMHFTYHRLRRQLVDNGFIQSEKRKVDA